MAVRSEVSKKNKYWLEKHRYYELKHFCLQYPGWKIMVSALDGLAKRPDGFIFPKRLGYSDPTAKHAIARSSYSDRINIVEKAAWQANRELSSYILEGATKGLSYDVLKARLDVPCCKDVYYELYRKFFWLLDKERD